ncbi:Retrovirus-related Pol polyprotein from transposon opus [Diplonema papillatum]|nr:Retrovirus-related Pol polyprotein from transposon opus [Diplonema papillatum]
MFSESSAPAITAFVDASTKGWGGVIVDGQTMELSILGDSWSPVERSLHINELEALALMKVTRALPFGVKGRSVHLVVDNTTVKGVARKGACLKSPVLNEAVVSSLEHLRALECPVSMRWVRSEDNPADMPSRVPLTDIGEKGVRELQLAVGRFLTGGVVGG